MISERDLRRWIRDGSYGIDLREACKEILRLRKQLKALAKAAEIEHGSAERDGDELPCLWSLAEGACDCGADEHNARVRAILEGGA